MNDQYPIGTICIGQNFVALKHRNDMECEIIGGLEMRKGKSITTGRVVVCMDYLVRWSDGTERNVPPKHLRRKPPKQSDSQWADEAIRKLKKQNSDHVVIGKPELIPEETA